MAIFYWRKLVAAKLCSRKEEAGRDSVKRLDGQWRKIVTSMPVTGYTRYRQMVSRGVTTEAVMPLFSIVGYHF
jgi:hypothetical protein